MKTLKIEIPEGYEIDQEKSTFEKIVFKEIKKELPKTWEELGAVSGWFTNGNSHFCKSTEYKCVDENKNNFATKEQAIASIALAQLSQLREVYRQSYKPDYMDNYTVKYGIYFTNQGLKIGAFYENTVFLMFQSEEVAKQFLANFGELIEQAKPLMS